MAINGIMLVVAYYVIFNSLLPVNINVQYFNDELVQPCDHLVVQHSWIANFSTSNSVDSWSKFLLGNHSERKLLTKTHFSNSSRLAYGSSLLFMSLMKCGDVHPHPGPQAPTPSQVTGDQFQQFQRKGMHMIHLNARSLVNKIPELKIIAQKTRAAVIGISETWFDDTITDAEIAISGYSVLRHDRNREGGGFVHT